MTRWHLSLSLRRVAPIGPALVVRAAMPAHIEARWWRVGRLSIAIWRIA